MIANPLLAKRIELSFWFSSGFNAKLCIEEMVDEYNNIQSDVKVKAAFQGLYEEMEMKMLTAAVTRQLPDVAQEKFEYLDLYIDEGLIKPIDNEITDIDREDIFGEMWSAVTRDGKIYGIPFCVNTYIFFINEDFFSTEGLEPTKLPTTWEEVIEIGKKLTADTNGDGMIDRYAMIFWQNGFESLAPFLWAYGGEFIGRDGSSVKLTSKEMYEAVSFIHAIIYKHGIMPHNWTNFEGGQAFLSGKLAMGPFISSGLTYFEDNLPWSLKITPFPYLKGERHLPLTGLALVNFAKNKKKRKAAHEFILWLVNKKNTVKIFQEVGYLPVRKSAVNSLELHAFLKENPNYSVPLDAIKYSRPLPNHREFYKINQMIIQMLERILFTNKDIMSELNVSEKAINSKIKQQ
jgi:ABC-type glycerol-3-phosphate transport system substrate-binding protein